MATLFLVGDPVAHSLSPAMQNAAFAALGLPHRYELLRTRSDDMASAVQRIRGDDVLGANVTIPHKEHIGRLLDAIEDTARRIGAVNTIFKRGGTLRGDNTDAGGFADALAEKGVDVRGSRVLLLGAGGAARACAAELIAAGAHVQISNRGPVRLRELVRAVPDMVGAGHSYAAVWPPPRSLDGYDVFVNATSLGLNGEDALEEVALPVRLAVVDVVATARETPLIRRAREAGCLAVDGLVMLLHQGARAFRLWTGLDAPLAAMRAALPRAI
jgi:shikimate dehydrogenase